MSRLATRAHVVPRALLRFGQRARPARIERILVAHHLLLGDTLMLGALLARLRRQHPRAEVVFTVAPACLPLYATRPWGVEALPFDPRRPGDARAITRRGPFDLAYVPGDNRHALLARAAGARWVVAFARDTPGWKNHLVDELVAWPATPTHLADLFAGLAGDGDEVFDARNWLAPACAPFESPRAPYAVLHVGAGSPLRRWDSERWRALAEHLTKRANPLEVVWSAGPGEEALVAEIDPQQGYQSFAGQLDLAQLWHLLAGAALLVAPDTGVVHLARITGTPTLCLFGPGSDVLFGASRFWRQHRFEAVIAPGFPCRDQRTLFKREIAWVRRCQRSTDRCAAPACMDALSIDAVIAAGEGLLAP
ncbi:MAG: glycosyltransferase family 9 protein [Burkholderiales bacterium]